MFISSILLSHFTLLFSRQRRKRASRVSLCLLRELTPSPLSPKRRINISIRKECFGCSRPKTIRFPSLIINRSSSGMIYCLHSSSCYGYHIASRNAFRGATVATPPMLTLFGVYRLQHRQCSDPTDGKTQCEVQSFCGVVLDVLTCGRVAILDPRGT